MVRRALAAILSLFLLATVGVGAVGADPLNAKGAAPFPVVCGDQTLMIVTNGRGEFTPGHIVGSTGVLVPTAFTFTAIQTSTGEVLFSGSTAKGQGQMTGLQGRLSTCTFGGTFDTPEFGQVTFVGTATVLATPQGR